MSEMASKVFNWVNTSPPNSKFLFNDVIGANTPPGIAAAHLSLASFHVNTKDLLL